MAPRNDSDDGLTSGAGQERRIGHVRGMSAEPSTTEVGVPIAPAPTCSVAITAGMNKTGTIEGVRTLATCIGHLKPRAGTFRDLTHEQ